MIAAARFREDLYHRLAVFPITLPPLRERPADILPLARDAARADRAASWAARGLRLSDGAPSGARGWRWPGNVRELANALERAAILADGPVIERPSISAPRRAVRAGRGRRGAPLTLAELEREAIAPGAGRATGGNRQQAAARSASACARSTRSSSSTRWSDQRPANVRQGARRRTDGAGRAPFEG